MKVEIKDGKITAEIKDGVYELKKVTGNRTLSQNNALWMYFTLLAEALNDAGYDMKKTIREDIDIPWSKDTIHSNLWLPVQKAMLDKKSTTQLNTDEVTKVYDVICREIGGRTGVMVEFPSIEYLMMEVNK